jgi:hypothetical protein
MRAGPLLAIVGTLSLGGCGGSSSSAGPMPPPQNAFTGTLSVTTALPAGTTACLATHLVVYTATGATPHAVSAAGGDCITFRNDDTANHQVAAVGTSACLQLVASGLLAPGGSVSSAPLTGPKSCPWEDLLNPPGGAGY